MAIILNDVVVYAEHNPAVKILNKISCMARTGQITLIVGKPGSGKSTLLDAMAGLIRVKSGQIVIEGETMWQGRRLTRAVQLMTGSVFQQPERQLFARTVRKEFDYSLNPYRLSRNENQDRILMAMHAVHLGIHLLTSSPFTLSGGQKRRVALGSTISTKPKWLFLDEPTSGLDPEAVQSLINFITNYKEQSQGGIVIVTHDLSAFLPIADHVVVLQGGSLVASVSVQELHENPTILLKAQVGLPDSMELAIRLKEEGIYVPSYPLSAAEMARIILNDSKNYDRLAIVVDPEQMLTPSSENGTVNDSVIEVKPTNYTKNLFSLSGVIVELDPRTKWLVYLLLSTGILFQTTWLGFSIATLITCGLVLAVKVRLRDLVRLLFPFIIFAVISTQFAALGVTVIHSHWISISYSIVSARNTGSQLFRIILLMVLGMLLPLTTSNLKIKRGLEQAIAVLLGMKVLAEAIALSVALMLRFIPLLTQEISKFSRIVRARGKSRANPDSIRARDIHVVMIPFIVSVFQLADSLSTAMEVRGYKRLGLPRTSSITLRMNYRDIIAIVIGLGVLCMLLVVR